MGVVDDVFPILGVALANVLFFAPLPGVAAVARAGMLGSFNVLPQAVMVLSTTVWVMYGLSVANPFIFAANAPGCIASVGYYIVTLPLIPQSASDTRRSMQTIVVAGAAFTVGLWGVLVFSGCPPATRSFYLGLYGSILCVAMFASPLSTVALVVATSDSSSIYAPLALAQARAAQPAAHTHKDTEQSPSAVLPSRHASPSAPCARTLLARPSTASSFLPSRTLGASQHHHPTRLPFSVFSAGA